MSSTSPTGRPSSTGRGDVSSTPRSPRRSCRRWCWRRGASTTSSIPSAAPNGRGCSASPTTWPPPATLAADAISGRSPPTSTPEVEVDDVDMTRFVEQSLIVGRDAVAVRRSSCGHRRRVLGSFVDPRDRRTTRRSPTAPSSRGSTTGCVRCAAPSKSERCCEWATVTMSSASGPARMPSARWSRPSGASSRNISRTCSSCSDEVRSLLPLHGLLARVDRAELDDRPDGRTADTIVARARHEQRELRSSRSRWRIVAVSSAAAALLIDRRRRRRHQRQRPGQPTWSEGPNVAAAITSTQADTAAVYTSARGWGTEIHVELARPPAAIRSISCGWSTPTATGRNRRRGDRRRAVARTSPVRRP